MTISELHGSGQPVWRRWVDLDGDGKPDLVVVTVASSTPAESEEVRVENLVAYLNVTPYFLDKREVLIFRQTTTGFVPWGEPLPLTGDTASVDVEDIDGDGRPEILYLAGYRIFAFRRGPGSAFYAPTPTVLVDEPMLLGTTRSFVPGARLGAEIVKGKPPSLLLATPGGLDIRRAGPDGSFPASASFVLRSGFREVEARPSALLLVDPHPMIVDADADGTLDLVFQHGPRLSLYKGNGDGTFAGEPRHTDIPQKGGTGLEDGSRGESLVVEDIDGDGLLDFLRVEYQDERGQGEDPGEGEDPVAKKPEKPAKLPLLRVEVRRGRPGFVFPAAPDTTFELPRAGKLEGAAVSLIKIDKDHRFDMLVSRYSTSLWQLARVMMTKKIAVKVSFETMLQRPDGTFAPPRGKPYETKVTFDIKRGIGNVPTGPRGDINGDGIIDLVEFDDRPELLVHLTGPDGVFPEEVALRVPLPRAPDDRALLDLEDLDGDGRADPAFFNLEGSGFVGTVLRSGP